VLPHATFDRYATAVHELLVHLDVGDRFVYVHDCGAPVALNIAMGEPERVTGLIIQNANAHHSGMGPGWADTSAFWAHPAAHNEAAATAHLTPAGVRDQYVAGVPADVARRISPAVWQEDWRVMSLPGRMATQRASIRDYANHVARFDEIAEYLRTHQPPALMLWGRHDAFFELGETLSWMQDLPRMEAHVFDAGHFLLESHAAPAAMLKVDFVEQVTRTA
jgi:pimeloyl-ACP methyl ester carboxylesterase